jgi:hypothetical protein
LKKTFSLITALVTNNEEEFVRLLEDNPTSINEVQLATGMNVPMMAVQALLPDRVVSLLEKGRFLNFNHRDNAGRSLMDIAVLTFHGEIIDIIQVAYETHAPDLISAKPSWEP